MTQSCNRPGSWRALRLGWIVLALMQVGSAIAEPINLGDVKQQARAYYANGYEEDLQVVGAAAQEWIRWRAPYATKAALVLDIDETALSNWPQLAADDFGYIVNGPCQLPKGPCGAFAWDRMAKAKAITPTLQLFKLARSLGVSVFFITGRDESERAVTERNLVAAGYVNNFGKKNWTKLIMRPAGTSTPSAADFKTPERAKIESSGYTIIANVGDQPSDLVGGHAERSFKLPNPFYRVP
jgi:predicted secreted acid phosphatase